MKKVILIIVVLILSFASVNAEWNLILYGTNPGRINIRLLSVPFEGLNSTIPNPQDSNRKFLIFNGPIHRRFSGQIAHDNPIFYSYSINEDLYLASCFSETATTGKKIYGFGKYLIEFINTNNPTKNISFIFNTLDSKAGMINILNGRSYTSDWTMSYTESGSSAFVVIDNGDNSSYRYIDTVFLGQTNREINYWYAYWRTEAPLAKDFYARTTPFPMNPYLVNDSNKLYDIKIGTKITFDTVYRNFGSLDRFGYNTVVETNGPHDYYNDPPNIPDLNDSLRGNIFTTPAHYYFNASEPTGFTLGMKITAENTDSIILKKRKILYINGFSYQDGSDTLLFQQGSTLIKEEGAKLNACYGGVIIDEGCNSVWAANSMQRIYGYSKLFYDGTSHLINNGGKVEIDSLAELHLGNNTVVTFDGANTNLYLKPGAKVFLSQNAKIVFKNGAYLKADNANFSGLNGATWEGIVFENAGTANEIKNCTFYNAKTSLRFENNSYGENSKAEIINNTFNVPQLTNAYGIYGNNMFKLNIKDNRFYNQSFNGYTNVGVYLKSSFNPGPPPEEDATPYALTIQYNLFKGGKAGIILANYASQYIPYSIYYNNFNDSTSYFSDYGIIGRKIDGDIKHCVFYPGKFNHNINVTQSNIKVANSHLNSNYYNFNLNNYSSLDIGGTESSGYNVYLGGFNYLSSLNNTNIYLSYYQSINLQNGKNCFLNYGGSGYYHLNGVINTEDTILYAVGNSWSNGMPVYSLVNRNNENMIVNYSPVYNCNSTTGLQIHQIVDKGNGLLDTIYKLPNSITFLNPETNLYLQAQQYANNSNYPTSILNLKTLISQYPTGMYLPYILNDLYLNYEKLDTSSNQGYRDNLYSDLKNFLNEKINSGLYDYQFNDLAYQIVLMCDGNMQNYNDALTGYEFIAMYHPDAATRLLASWDYVEIDALLNGMGGGYSENISEEKFAKNEMKRLEKVIRKDSVLTSLKRNYDKLSKEQSRETKTDLKSKNIDVYEKALYKKEKDEKIIRKSMTVLMGSKSMSRELKAEKQLEDILLITSTNSDKKVYEGNSSLPGNYNLSQNYPNPFNPTTKINFALPKQGFVSLKIYDITGREIQTLVNEVKQAGYYSVDFNGSSLSSGVYFYMIKSGDFVMTKRMVLIK